MGLAETYELDFDQAPASRYMDRWVYPFNIFPGSRIQAPTFGAVGSEGFDDRDGQYLLAINTAELGIPSGSPAAQYQIDSARLVLTEGVGGYVYDSTYDSYTTYLDRELELSEPDLDAGRPIELYGAGFRNDFEEFGWPDGAATDAPVFSSASAFGPSDRGTRSVFASDATGRDVSNNVDSLNAGVAGFDPKPFSVAVGADANGNPLSEGSEVEAGAEFTFEIDTSDAAIQAYLQAGLSRGQLGFVVSSLHATGQEGAGDPFVNLATSNHFAVAGPRFEISVSIVDRLPGDFDGNGLLDVADLDLLNAEIDSGGAEYDLDGDSMATVADLRIWINDLFGSFVGDANLDGEFNSADFVSVFGAGTYEDGIANNSTWATGDWNGDREFDSGDFVEAFQGGGYEQGPRALVAVPEATSMIWLILPVVLVRRFRV